MSYNYSTKKYDNERMARAVGISLPISTKQAVELCGFIRNKTVKKSKEILGEVIRLKKAVPFRRFNRDLGHKKKIGAARYPVKTAKAVLALIESAEANAQFKGLNTNELLVFHIKADKSGKTWHYGRKRRRQMKRTNVEVMIEEKKGKAAKTEKKEAKASKAGKDDKTVKGDKDKGKKDNKVEKKISSKKEDNQEVNKR